MVNLRRIKFPIFAIICQVAFLILFGVLVDYDDHAKPKTQDSPGNSNNPDNPTFNIVNRVYPSK